MTDATRYCAGCRSTKPSIDFTPTARRCRECTNISARRRRAINYEAELKRQGGGCAICRKLPPGWRGKLVIDHDPAPGNFRGLLCEPCNLMCGYAQEDAAILAAGAEYLAKPGRPVNTDLRIRRSAPVQVSYREPVVRSPQLVPTQSLRVQDTRKGSAR